MGKSYSKGNRAAQRYRARIRKGSDMIIKAPWGKEFLVGEDGSTQLPPQGWFYWENQWGRGFTSPVLIATPYDFGISEDRRSKEFPKWYKKMKRAKG